MIPTGIYIYIHSLYWKQWPLHCAVSPRERMHGSGNYRGNIEVSLFAFSWRVPSEPLRVYVLLFPATSDSVRPEVLSWGHFCRGDMRVPLHFKLQLPPSQRPADKGRCHHTGRGHRSCSSAGGRTATTQEGPSDHHLTLGIPLPNVMIHGQVQQMWISDISGMTRGSALPT